MKNVIILLLIAITSTSFSFKSANEKSRLLQNKKHIELLYGQNCLEQYYNKPEELLTLELVSKYVDFEGAEVKIAKVSEQIIRDKDFATVNCEWRINKIRHKIQLSGIFKMKLYDKTPVERFFQKYHTRTEEETNELTATYKTEVEEKAKDENAAIVSNAMDFDFEYIKVEGIGDAAVWEHKVNALKVLVGAYQFTLSVDLKKSSEDNLEKAKLIAKDIIIRACK